VRRALPQGRHPRAGAAGRRPRRARLRPHKVEVLADGQQFVAFGLHPGTGRPYAWPDGSPLDLERDDLPPLDARAAARFAAAAEGLLVARFAARPVPPLGGRASRPGSAPRTPPRPARDLGEARAVLAALDRLPNADLAYGDWIAVGYALKAALGEAARPVFLAGRRPRPRTTRPRREGVGVRQGSVALMV
jgi:hypothetical protein